MKHKYDLFEKFSDGSSLWRDFVLGSETTQMRMMELAQESENYFYAIDITTGRIITLRNKRNHQVIHPPSKTDSRNESQVA